jgi:signal transduction histidine kinase/DNA-binding response OmpR family regulator/streptogramin lyase
LQRVHRFLDDIRRRGIIVHTTTEVHRFETGGAHTVDMLSPRRHALIVSDGRDAWRGVGATLWRNNDVVVELAPQRAGDVLPPDDITSVILDREGSIWLGTQAAGLHRLKPTLFRTFSTAEGLADRNVYATYVDRRGEVLVGSWGRGLSRISPESGAVERLGTRDTPPSSINTFLEDRSGVLWVGGGSSPSGLFRCTREPVRRCEPERTPVTGFDDPRALHEDADGRLWVGTRVGLYRRDATGWVRLDTLPGAPRQTVRTFAVSRDGAIWMGTDGGGVARYRDGVFTPVTARDGLPSDGIRSLYVDRDGWLWIGTEGRGLARLDPRGWGANGTAAASRRIATINVSVGLFDNVIHQILEDDASRLWMSTNRGIFWVSRPELMAYADGRIPRVQSTGYTERDGMRNREANGGVQPAGARGLDGRLWFPTQDGVVVVDPKTLQNRDSVAPPVIVEQVIAGDSTLLPARGAVTLSAAQRDVRIEFTALTFLEPRNVRFRYRLNGYDRDWVDAGNRRSAFYTQLPPGTYTFEVQVSTVRNAWHTRGASLTLTASPRWFETGLVKLSAALALLALLVLGIRRRVSDATERAVELERVVAERTATLRERERLLAAQAEELQALDKARSRFFANVSHELRTPLTLTIGPIEDARNIATSDPRVERWLDIALRNARRLLRLVNQILDVAKLEAGEMRLDPRPMDLSAFLRGLLSAFQPVAERKRITMQIEAPEVYRVILDADAIEKIVTNLLSNAVKFTPHDGHVVMTLTAEEEQLVIAVRDSGPGIPADRLAHVFERFYQVDESVTSIQPGTGIGLSLVKELVDLQRGTVTVASDADGTVFTVTLPAAGVDVAPPAGVTGERRVAPFVSNERPVLTPDEMQGAQGAPDVPTMLVVDDSADLRTYIRDHFEDRFRILEAEDGAAGTALAREHLPDIIVSDVMMPGTDGHALVRALRDSPETDFLAIILLTAMAEDEARMAGLEGGADDYLVKPFEMRELDVRVRNMIAARRRLRSRFMGEEQAGGVVPAAEVTAVSEAVALELSSDDAAYLERVRAAIRSRLRDPDFGVSELADAVFQDRSHLFRRVRQVSGMSPSELLRSMRLAEAARLLASGQGSVADVTYAVGYNSVSYFTRAFQSQYGVTPAAYRGHVAAR